MNTIILSAVLLACSVCSQAQVRVTSSPPDPGYQQRINEAVAAIKVVDSHDHLIGVTTLAREHPIDFTLLFYNYSRTDFRSSGMPEALYDRLWAKSAMTVMEKWHAVQPYWEASSNTGFNRAGLLASAQLFGVKVMDATTVEELSRRVASVYQSDARRWFYAVLKEKCGIEYVIQDALEPEVAGDLDPGMFKFVRRFDQFVWVHSRKDLQRLDEQSGGRGIDSLDDLTAALDRAFEAAMKEAVVGVKSGVAYKRTLLFENVTRQRAQAVFESMNSSGDPLSFDEAKPLQDYMMHLVLGLAQKHRLPVQFHTGLQWGFGNQIENSKPTHLVRLLNEFPDVKFIFFHGSYPYGGELATIAKNFQNAYIDANWTHILSPTYSERYLHEWLETVPASKLLAFGGDDLNVEAVFGNISFARQLIAKVLIAKVRDQYLTEAEAIKVANMILRENAMKVFGLRSVMVAP